MSNVISKIKLPNEDTIYEIQDSKALRYTPQELTAEEQQQAKENLNINSMVIDSSLSVSGAAADAAAVGEAVKNATIQWVNW